MSVKSQRLKSQNSRSNVIPLSKKNYSVEANEIEGRSSYFARKPVAFISREGELMQQNLEQIVAGIQQQFEEDHMVENPDPVYDASKVIAARIAQGPIETVALAFGIYYLLDKFSRED